MLRPEDSLEAADFSFGEVAPLDITHSRTSAHGERLMIVQGFYVVESDTMTAFVGHCALEVVQRRVRLGLASVGRWSWTTSQKPLSSLPPMSATETFS